MKKVISCGLGILLLISLLTGCGQRASGGQTNAMNQRMDQSSLPKTTRAGKKELKKIKKLYQEEDYQEAYDLANEMVTTYSDELSPDDHNSLMAVHFQLANLAQAKEDIKAAKKDSYMGWESRVFANINDAIGRENGDKELAQQAEALLIEANKVYDEISAETGLKRAN